MIKPSHRSAPVKCAIATLLSFSIVGATPLAAIAETSAQLQTQLDAAQAKLNEYDQTLQSAFAQLEEKQASLEDTRAQISSTQEEIQKKQTELEGAQDTLSTVIANGYKSRSGLMEFLLDSSSFEDLISRVYYAQKVNENQQQAISEVRTIQDDLSKKNEQLQQAQAEQEQQVSAAQDAAAQVQEQQAQQSAYVQSLSSEVQEALKREEEAARQAQEAAARAAASQASSSSSSNSGGGQSYDDGDDDGGSSSSSGGGYSRRSSGGDYSSAVSAALSQVGVAYSYAGNAIEGVEFDCSGLVWWAYSAAGISIPRGQRMSNGYGNSMIGWCLSNGGWTTDQSQLQAGDLMFWGSSTDSTTHVGMCIGGGQMIHSNYGGVEITSVYYSSGSFVGGGPIV